MTIFPALALLAILVVSLLLQHKKSSAPYPRPLKWATLMVLSAVSALLVKRFAPNDFAPVCEAALIGCAVVIAAALIERFEPHPSATLSLGALSCACLMALHPARLDHALLALPAAAALTALVITGRTAAVTVMVASVSCLVALFGSRDQSFSGPAAGVMLFGAAALLSLGGLAINRVLPKSEKAWPVLACILFVAVAYAASVKYLSLTNGWIGVTAAPLVALIAYWLMSNSEEGKSFPLLVSAALWLGLSIAAFGLARTYGVSLALTLAVGMFITLNADRALVSAAPMLAVVLTQVFRQLHPDAAHSVDVGQNYILVGLALGALIPLLPVEWQSDKRTSPRSVLGDAVWAAALCATPFFVGIYLAPRGLVGFVAGLGLAGLFSRSQSAILVPVLSLGIACLSALEYDWMGALAGLSRSDKMHWFLYAGGLIAVTAALLAILSPYNASRTRQAPRAA